MKINWRNIVSVFLLCILSSSSFLFAATVSQEIFNQGMTHYANKNYRDAEFYLGQVLHDNALNDSARYYLAAAMAMQGKGNQALPHLQYLLQKEPENQSYKDLFNQVSKVAAISQRSQAPQRSQSSGQSNVESSGQSDSYVRGIQKTTVIGEGGYVPLITEGAPITMAPKMPAGYEQLADKVTDHDPNVRREAIRSLIDKKDVKLIEVLAWALSDQPCREFAARALVNLGEPGIKKLIGFADKNTDFNNQKFVFSILGRIDSPVAEKAVFETWEKGHASLMSTFESSFVAKGDRLIPVMISHLGHKSAKIRLSAVQVLIRLGEAAIEPAIAKLNDGKGIERVEAVNVLSGLPRDKVFEKMTKEMLTDLKADEVAEISAFAKSMLPDPALEEGAESAVKIIDR